MEKLDQLWEYMQEDMKADRINNEIKRSPVRQKLEKTRDFIMEQQKAYKQIEEQVSISADRKDGIRDALKRSQEQLKALEERLQTNPPTDLEAARAMIAEVDKCRKTIVSYEQEMRRMQKESSEYDSRTKNIRLEAARAKQEFDQLKGVYEEETKAKKGELEAQRAVAAAKKNGIPENLLAEYESIKKHVSPPIAKLVGSQCTGCNTSLPSAVLRKLDEGKEIIECETCGRMLIK